MGRLGNRLNALRRESEHVSLWGLLRIRLIGRYNRFAGSLHLRQRWPVVCLRLRSGAVVYLRTGTSDYDALTQIFIDREYEPLDCLTSVKTILDCGANVGYSSVYFLERFPSARVIALEPDPQNAWLCRKNLARYGNRAQVVAAALWDHPARLSLVRGEYGDGREWATQVCATRSGEDFSGGEVAATDMPSVLSLCGTDPIDILKIDIERSELVVFQGPTKWLSRVRNIAIELHDDDCKRVFFGAMDNYRFHVVRSGELTICLDIAAA